MVPNPFTFLAAADWIALALFAAGTLGYSWYADRAARGAVGLRGVTHTRRLEWARQMVARDNRILDSSLTGNLIQSVSFYANTTIYILAGLIAIAGTLDRLMSFAADLPFGHAQARELVEVKVFLLIGIFVFAYFKFTWSLRQYSFLSILIGAAPAPGAGAGELERHAQRFAAVNSLAGDEFNRGIRTYYFGFAVLAWFGGPVQFVVMTAAILAVLWRRDFRSHTLRAMAG